MHPNYFAFVMKPFALIHGLALAAAALVTAPSIAQQDSSMFEPGLISDGGVFGLTLSPNGKHALFVKSNGKREKLVIMESFLVQGKWQAPRPVPFSNSDSWKDIDPVFSPDGKQLIYQSTRPVPGKPDRKGFDIWSVTRTANGWKAPVHLGNRINSDESESSASIAANGTIYFMKNQGEGNSDLWKSPLVNGEYQAPENLGAPVNTAQHRESNPYIAPDESYLIYFSSDPAGLGDVDLFISFREKDGWGAPKHIDAPINSALAEFCPWVHKGRIYLSRQVKQGDRMIENIHAFPFNPADYKHRPAKHQ